jgi:hypothetical protein
MFVSPPVTRNLILAFACLGVVGLIGTNLMFLVNQVGPVRMCRFVHQAAPWVFSESRPLSFACSSVGN